MNEIRRIPERVHAGLDYLLAIVFVFMPMALNFADLGPATYVPVVVGFGLLGYSMLTKYELGLYPVITFRDHLTFDLVAGLVLATSPWVFGFADRVFVPHLIAGLAEMSAALMTKVKDAAPKAHAARQHKTHHRAPRQQRVRHA